MKIRTKILLILIALMMLTISVGYFIISEESKNINYLETDFTELVNDLNETSYLDGIAELIRYDDEVLTQSARNYAFTGDKKWKTRYEEFVPKLELRINQAIEKGDDEDKQAFSNVDEANLALVAMEEEAIKLVDEGNKDEAQKILESSEYWKQKEIYKSGLDQYLTKRNTAYDEAIDLSTKKLSQSNENLKKSINYQIYLYIVFIIIFIIFLIIIYFIFIRSILNPVRQIQDISQKIIDGDLDKKLEIKSRDEIGLLSENINQMTNKLKEEKTNIEGKVAQRTKELEKINEVLVGREIRMIELKEQISKLRKNKEYKTEDSETWEEKFQIAIDVEESVIQKLKSYYLLKVEHSDLDNEKKQQIINRLNHLVEESIDHENKFKELIKYEQGK